MDDHNRARSSIDGFKIGQRTVGPGRPCLIVAEIGQAHDGSLGTAHAYIDAVASTGVDAVKFQTHIADAESSPGEPFRVQFSPQDETRYDYWKRMEFSTDQWSSLAGHASQAGLIFLSTPFSMEAVELLAEIGMPAWKIGSGEVSNLPMIEHICGYGRPILLSSGLSSWQELGQAVLAIRQKDVPLGIFQCTTSYPCPPEKIGLNVIGELRERFSCPAGLSDHSGSIYPGLAAATLGAEMLEVHVTLSRDCFGPDVKASITISELKKLVQGIRLIEQMLANPLDKDTAAGEMADLRLIFGKSLFAARDLPKGHALAQADLSLKKPGTGLPAALLPEVIGRRLSRRVPEGSLLRSEDLV